MTIKAGYELKVTSWENDGDCYNTKSIQGLTKEGCLRLVMFCEEVSQSRWESNSALVENALKNETVKTLLTKHFSEDYDFKEEYLEDYTSELLYELIGNSYESDYPRVLESYEVYFHKEELHDLSKEFF